MEDFDCDCNHNLHNSLVSIYPWDCCSPRGEIYNSNCLPALLDTSTHSPLKVKYNASSRQRVVHDHYDHTFFSCQVPAIVMVDI